MNRAPTVHEVERFRSAVSHAFGLRGDACSEQLLRDVLQRRLASTAVKPSTYLQQLDIEALAGTGEQDELAVLARELTVGETYFFRQEEQFRALVATVLPDRLRATARDRSLRILSAGCSTGEEAYTIAMVLHDAIADPGSMISVRAVDINAAALARARSGQYAPWALRKTGLAMRRRWFRESRRHFVVDASLRELVRFELRNLAHDDAELWQPGSLDVVFCRNVIMYFAPDQARALLARIARALKPGGYLFLGEAETLRGLSEECELRHTEGAFYYRLGVAPASPQAVELPQPTKLIRRAQPPIAAPVQAEFAARAPTSGSALQPVEAARELYREERFVDALAALRGPGGSMAPPAGAQGALLEAMLLVHGGELAAAEDACRRQLGAAGGDANARYVLALCREGLGDHAGAIAQSRSAARLDPAFAMPRLHLGMAARRAGDWTAARDQLLQALTLLAHEDDERLLLFGGGFTRAALLAFCGATLRDCGGRP